MSIKIIANNKRARYDYTLKELFEAGLVLVGTEVKSLREGNVRLLESYIGIDRHEEMWIYNMSIPTYKFGNRANHDETRKRKLLMHKREIKKIALTLKRDGGTIVPTKIYFKKGHVKIELAIAKGKKIYDKRQDKAKKDIERKLRQGKLE